MKNLLSRKNTFAAVSLPLIVILLGAWAGFNYAAIICADFPACRGSIIPSMDFLSATQLWEYRVGSDVFGISVNDANVTYQWAHRLEACMTVAVMLYMLTKVWQFRRFNKLLKIIVGLLIIQVTLGISNVIFSIPPAIAVAHNGAVEMLLMSLVTLFHYLGLPKDSFARGTSYE